MEMLPFVYKNAKIFVKVRLASVVIRDGLRETSLERRLQRGVMRCHHRDVIREISPPETSSGRRRQRNVMGRYQRTS